MATRHASKKVLRNDEDDDNHAQREYEDAEAAEYFARPVIAAPKVRVEAKPPTPAMMDPDFFSTSTSSDDFYGKERYTISASAWYTEPHYRPYNPYWDDEWVVAERNMPPAIDITAVMNTTGKTITISGPAAGGAGASSASYERIGGEAPVKMTHAGAAKSNTLHLSAAHTFEAAYRGKRNHRD